jgi:Flp pilus assembly protein TadG
MTHRLNPFARRSARRRLAALTTERSGAAAVEFALIAPALLMILLATIQFGLTLNQYLELTNGVTEGGRTLAVSRSSATPYTSAKAAITSAAPGLTAASITTTVKINGTACTSDATCSTAMTSAAGQAGYVSATYPCSLTVMGVNFAPSCTLTATTTDMIE